MPEIKIGDVVIAERFGFRQVEDIYKSETGNPSLYKLKGLESLFEAHEINYIRDDDAS